jgi:hypothetical protein
MDKLQNGTETDIDCGGGNCQQCATGKACQVDFDCASFFCSNNVCTVPPLGSSYYNPGATCLAIKTALPASVDGIYWIDPDGSEIWSYSPFQVYCNMTADGGGWTLWAYTSYNGTPSQNVILPVPGTNNYLAVGYGYLRLASSEFMARGADSGTRYYLSKAEADAASCHSMSGPNPEMLDTTTAAFGHTETTGCDATGGDAAYLAILESKLTVQSTATIGLWHSGSSSGPTLNLDNSTGDAAVELYLR